MNRRDFITQAAVVAAPAAIVNAQQLPFDPTGIHVSRTVALAGLPSAKKLMTAAIAGKPPRASWLAEHAVATHIAAHHLAESPNLRGVIDHHLQGRIVTWDASVAEQVIQLAHEKGIRLTPDLLEPVTRLASGSDVAQPFSVMLKHLHNHATAMHHAAVNLEGKYATGELIQPAMGVGVMQPATGVGVWRYRWGGAVGADAVHFRLAQSQSQPNNTPYYITGLIGGGAALMAGAANASAIVVGMGASAELGAAVAASMFFTGGFAVVVGVVAAGYLLLNNLTAPAPAPDPGGGMYHADASEFLDE